MICSRTQAVFVVVILLFFCVSARAEDFKDIVYREVQGIALLMDAHLPDGAGPFPAAVLVHGGGWIAGDKQQYITYLFQPLAEAGFAWFSINYRLAPKFTFPAAAEDVGAAIDYVQKNPSRYRVDPRRIVLSVSPPEGSWFPTLAPATRRNQGSLPLFRCMEFTILSRRVRRGSRSPR